MNCNNRVTVRHKTTPCGTLGWRQNSRERANLEGVQACLAEPGRGGGWPWRSGEVGLPGGAAAVSGIAEQTMGDPLACGQEAGDEQQEVWGALGGRGPWRGRGPLGSRAVRKEAGPAGGGPRCAGPAAGGWCFGCTGPGFATERAADSSPPIRGGEAAERLRLWAAVWAGSLGGCRLRRLWASLFTGCSEMWRLYPPFPSPLYNCLKFLLNIPGAPSDSVIFATSVKRHLGNLKGSTAFTYIFILSIVVFLLGVPTVLLSISFCFESVLGPFL